MKRGLKRVSIVALLGIGIVVFTMIGPKKAYAPHVSESTKTEKQEEAKKKTGYLYLKCPHCGKAIKVKVKVSK